MQYGADQLERAMLVIQYILRAKNVGADHEPIWILDMDRTFFGTPPKKLGRVTLMKTQSYRKQSCFWGVCCDWSKRSTHTWKGRFVFLIG